MLDWLKNLDPAVLAAIISGVVAIIVAVISGVFGLIKKRDNTKSSTSIKQKQGLFNKGTQIGIQNNYNSSNSTTGEEKDE